MSGDAITWARSQSVGDSRAKALLKEYAYWASEDYSTWAGNDTLREALEFDVKTIRAARDRLVELGYLVETRKRRGGTGNIVVFQMIAPVGSVTVQTVDQRTQQVRSLSPPSLDEYMRKGDQKRSPSKSGTPKGNRKRHPSENGTPPETDARGTENGAQGVPDFPQGVPDSVPEFIELGFELTRGSIAREADASETDKTSPTPGDEEPDTKTPLAGFDRFWAAWPANSGRKQARELCLSHWTANGLEAHVHLIVAHVEAMKRTQHWKTGGDPTPIRYLEGRRWRDCSPDELADPVVIAAGGADDAHGKWWESDSGLAAQGKRTRTERRPNEINPDFLVRVAKASGKGPWIDYVLKRERGGNPQRYQQIVDFFGDELLPVDHYPS